MTQQPPSAAFASSFRLPLLRCHGPLKWPVQVTSRLLPSWSSLPSGDPAVLQSYTPALRGQPTGRIEPTGVFGLAVTANPHSRLETFNYHF